MAKYVNKKSDMDYAAFFFQAKDGIRAHCVTGVQTCALPISAAVSRAGHPRVKDSLRCRETAAGRWYRTGGPGSAVRSPDCRRSEERRVGKECKSRWC